MRKDSQNIFSDPEFLSNLERYEESQETGEAIYMDAEDLTDIAEYYMTNEEEEKADACIALAVKLHPEATSPRAFIGRQYLFHGNIKEAYKILNSIQDKSEVETIFLHAELLMKERKVEEANKILTEKFDQLECDQDHYMYDVSDIFYNNGYYEDALIWANRLIRDYPNYPESKMLKADILQKLERYEEAACLAEDMLNEDSFNQDAWMILAECYVFEEKYIQSLEACEYLLAINEKHPEAMLTRASNLFYLNRIEEAHKQYQAYLTLYPDEYTILYLDGVCLSNLGRSEESRDVLIKALDKSDVDAPERIHIYFHLAYIYSKLEEKDKALEQLMYCRNYPQPEPPIDLDLAKGHILLENKDYEEAEKCFDISLSKSENKFDTLLLIGITLGETGHYEKAIEVFEGLYESEMEEAAEKTTPYLAYCYLFLDKQEEYLRYLKEAIALNPYTTQFLFSQFFPNVAVEDFYESALKQINDLQQ